MQDLEEEPMPDLEEELEALESFFQGESCVFSGSAHKPEVAFP